MKKLFWTVTLALLLCFAVSAAPAINTIDTSNAVEVYRNTFDDASALNDFTQFRGKWGVEDGRAYVLPGQAGMNAYFLYTGEDESLHDLSDYVVSVEMYNVRQATGLVARCDLATANTAGHGYMGINASCQTDGRYFFTRVTSKADGSGATSLGSAPVIFAPGANIRLEVAMRGKVIQTAAYDLDNNGMLLWVRSAVTDLHPSGSFGLFAYTAIVNGLDVSETRFDNLVVKTLSDPVSDAENFDVYTTTRKADISSAVEVYRNTFDDASALNDFTQYSGTWIVKKDGTVALDPQVAAKKNAYFAYTGTNTTLQNLTDYIVEVDMYNVRQASGLVARVDLKNCNEAMHGYMGYNAAISSNGTYAFVRATSDDGGAAASTVCKSSTFLSPDDHANLHLTLVMYGNTVQYIITDIDTGEELCSISGETDLAMSGSFGLMAYTTVTTGDLDCRETYFDNLVVKTFPASSEDSGYAKVDYAAEQHGNDRLDILCGDTYAVHKTLTMENGTAEVDLFMPAAATKNDLQAVKGDYREESAGLIFNRSEDGSSYYKLQMYRKSTVSTVTDGAIEKISTTVYTQLYKVVNGTETKLKSFYMEASGLGSWGVANLRVVKDGGKIYCYMNDRCYIAIEDAEPLTGKGIALFGDLANTAFANLKVSDVTACDKADLVTWGHSHIGGWINFCDVMAEYGKGVNIGLGGSATNDMPNVINEIASYEPEIVVIMIGSNNYGSGAEKNTADLKKYNEQLHELLPEAKIVVITEWWQPGRYPEFKETVMQLNEAYRAYAAETDYVYIVEGFSLAVTNGEFDESKFKDSGHFNPATYKNLDDRACTLIGSFYGNKGDIDGDGDVSIKDVLLSLRGLVNATYPRHADRDFDGEIGLLDCLTILRTAVQ